MTTIHTSVETKVEPKVADEFADCVVCTERRRVKVWVTCPKCSFACCRSCVKTYLLGLPEMTPKCMSCGIRWTLDFIADHTDDAFHNHEYREHRAKILLERERSLLPETQPFVEREKRKVVLKEKAAKLEERIQKLEAKAKELKNRRFAIRMELNEVAMRDGEAKHGAPGVERKFIGHCPAGECRGFLEHKDRKYQCGLCETEVCKECRKVKGEEPEGEHKCNPDDVETAKLISSSTKPCPSCSVPIFKTEGCDQMYCVKCHTAFSWQTGALEKGRIHNPHYYEFMRRQNGGVAPREPGDIVCGGLPGVWQLTNRMTHLNILSRVISAAHEVSGHIRAVELPHYQVVHNEGENRDLRVKYMMDKITPEGWQAMLKKREKKKEKYAGVYLILRMTTDTIDTLLQNFMTVNTKRDGERIVDELENLREYTNQQLRKLATNLGNKVPHIAENWSFKSVQD